MEQGRQVTMLVTKKKYNKLAKDYQRLYFEYENYVRYVNAPTMSQKQAIAKKKPVVKPSAIKKTTAKKVK
jgi:hypothetical protein